MFRFAPPALPREGLVPHSCVFLAFGLIWLPAPSYPWDDTFVGRRVSMGAQRESGEWEARLLKAVCLREGCHQIIMGLSFLFDSFPFH